MRMLLHLVALVSLSSLADQAQAMRCAMGQEHDPTSPGKYRWVIPVEDPCQCTEIRLGGVNKRTTKRNFNVTYYDTPLKTKDPAKIRQWLNCSDEPSPPIVLDSCQAYIDAGLSEGDGLYKIIPNCGIFSIAPINVYCDQTSNNGGWMRFYYKTGPRSCTKYGGFTWTGELIRCLGLDTNITGFAVSDDINTINTENSWILNDGTWVYQGFYRCYSVACDARDLLEDLGFANSDVIANLANCKTPTGEDWSQTYEGGHARIAGTLSTNGDWESTYYGCFKYTSPGDSFTLRFGGAPGHTGEFVHTVCNDYTTEPRNRVTFLWNTDNVRAMWIKLP